jgi:transcriptional regulator with PAS, ATPase and Fis domain
MIHDLSPRAKAPFVEVNCAGLNATFLDSELFGHEKGAFTGATGRKTGHLATAHGGTLFLDEIGEITPATQVKLLRFLQDRRYVPLGSTEERSVDARVVSATNRDLDEAVRSGRFREDFYYRLNVFTIRVPPLRDRREDVGALVRRFLESRGLPLEKLSRGATDALLAHAWPGNVRELENALERALILAGDGEIRPEHLAVTSASPRGRPTADLLVAGFSLDAFERELILAALERAGGNKTHAARLLGVTRRRLYSLLESMGRKDEDGR